MVEDRFIVSKVTEVKCTIPWQVEEPVVRIDIGPTWEWGSVCEISSRTPQSDGVVGHLSSHRAPFVSFLMQSA